MIAVLVVAGCGAAPTSGASAPGWGPPAPLTASDIAALVPARVDDRPGWGAAILNALAANELPVDRASACAVVAIIGQESGYQEDPVVPGIAALAAARIDRYKAKLGPLGDPVFDRLLSGRSPEDARPFQQRLATLRTERDADVLFRDLLAYYQANHPALFTAAEWAGKATSAGDVEELADLNPITTAGPMQVSVRFAQDWARAHKGRSATSSQVRDALYTRAGGVYYGTARLLAYAAHYDQPLFRFADYNAGYYASRNAAVQAQLSRLTGRPLTLDGDLLSYNRKGEANDAETESQRAVAAFAARHAPQLSARDIRRDLLTEKTLAFESTETYRAIKQAASRRWGAPAAYARLPNVAINSPKFTQTRSTAWFARSVDRRYRTCLGRTAAP